jgi:pSer/pThr/pTyr-binding forkhead associated (FHA) protein
MSFIELDGHRHPIPPGESAVGSNPDSFITLQGAGVTPRHLLLRGGADGQVAVRRADEHAETYINGVRLGPQPTPLLHGDKIELGGFELLFVDERRSGSTQFVSAEELAALRPPGAKAITAPATAATGGRVVSLTDGREYTVVGSPLVFGREAGCDVVVTSKRVSRRHAEIVATPKGYLVVDTSTNGTFVNDERIDGERLLKRADVIRVGDDEFRFYADLASPPKAAADAASEAAGPPGSGGSGTSQLRNTVHGMSGPVQESPAPGAEFRLGQTLHGMAPETKGPADSPPAPPKTPPDQSAPQGAPQRLGNTMHGIPASPRPGATGEPLVAPQSPAPAPAPGAASAPPVPSGAEFRLGNTMHGIPSVPRPGGGDQPPPGPQRPMAHLVGRSGEVKGQRFEIRVPVVNVGRANYNDIVIVDSTVSTIHAKLQRREGIWVLTDLDSTNGTFVDGERVSGEVPIAPGAILRFGDVSTTFEPLDDGIEPGTGGSTRVVDSINLPKPGPASAEGGPQARPAQDDTSRERSGFRLWPFK